MKDISAIPSSNISRLPRYYRFLTKLENEGIKRISSGELAEQMNVTASQIRQDFSCFGLSGQQGYGYTVTQLKNEIATLLGLETIKYSVLIGAGNLGKAVASLFYLNRGFNIIAAFDNDESLIGEKIGDIPVKNISELKNCCDENNIICAFVCIPEKEAPAVVAQLENMGVNCFWNFSHYDIKNDYPDAIVENVHLGDSLMILSYSISADNNRGEKNAENCQP